MSPSTAGKTFKDNASRNINTGAGVRYTTSGKVIAAFFGDKINTTPYDFKEPEFTESHNTVMAALADHKLRKRLKSIDAGGYTSASTYGGKSPFDVVKAARRVLDNDADRLVSFDIETVGSPFSNVDKMAYKIFSPTELAIQAYTRNSSGQYAPSGQLFNVLVRPDDTTFGHLESLVKKLEDAGTSRGLGKLKLTEAEHRSIVDLMRYSELTDAKYFGNTALATNAQAGYRSAATIVQDAVTGFSAVKRHHGMFDLRITVAGKEINFSEQLYRASHDDLFAFVEHAKSGLQTLKKYGADARMAIGTFKNVLTDEANAGSLLAGANEKIFDFAATRETLRKIYGEDVANKFTLPRTQLDVTQLLTAIYPDSRELHIDARASVLFRTGKYKTFEGARQEAARTVFAMHGRVSDYSHKMESLAETMFGTHYKHSAGSDVEMPINIINEMRDVIAHRLDAAENMPLAPLGEFTHLPHEGYAIRIGDKIYAKHAYLAGTDDPFSFRHESVREIVTDASGNAHARTIRKKTYGDYVVNKRVIYDVKDIWQTQAQIGGESADLFGVTLYDPMTRSTSRVVARSRDELADKMQGFAVNMSAMQRMGKLDEKASQQFIASDRARRMYENMLDIGGTASKKTSSGIGLAKKLYGAAKEVGAGAQWQEYKQSAAFGAVLSSGDWNSIDPLGVTPEIGEILERHGIRTSSQQRNFMRLMPRLESEADIMLDVISHIESRRPANASLAFAQFHKMLDPVEEKLVRTGFNPRNVRIFSEAADSVTSIDLSSTDAAIKSLYGVIDSANRQRVSGFISDEMRDAYRRSALTNMLDRMVQMPAEGAAQPLLTAKDYTSIMGHETTHQRINTLASILSDKPDSLLMPDETISSIAPRAAMTVGGRVIDSATARGIVDSIADDISMTVMPYAKGDQIKEGLGRQLYEAMKRGRDVGGRAKLKAMNDAQLQAVADSAANIYYSLAANKAGQSKTAALFKMLDDGQLQMVLYNSDHKAAVLGAAFAGKHTSYGLSVDMPMLNELGNWTIGNTRKQAQHVLTIGQGTHKLSSVPELIAEQIGRSSQQIKEAIDAGQLNRAWSRIRWAQTTALSKLGGFTGLLAESDIDPGSVQLAANLGGYLSDKTLVVDELMYHPLYGLGKMKGQDKYRYTPGFQDPKELVAWYTGDEGVKAFFGRHGEELGAKQVYASSLRESGVLSGKVSTMDARNLVSYGEYTKFTRMNMLQIQNYHPVAGEQLQGAMDSGLRPWSTLVTRERLIGELSLSGVDVSGISPDMAVKDILAMPGVDDVMRQGRLHSAGLSVHALALNDTQIEQVRKASIERIRGEIASATGTEADRLRNILGTMENMDLDVMRPSTFEQQSIPTPTLAKRFQGYGEKRYVVNAADMPDDFRQYIDEYMSTGKQVQIDPQGKKMLLAKSTEHGREGVPTYFNEVHGGPVQLLDVKASGGKYDMRFGYNLPGGPGVKYGIEGEKTTGGMFIHPDEGIASDTIHYMFGNDVDMVYSPNPIKRKDYGATLSGMHSYAADVASSRGPEYAEIFRQLQQKHLGFVPEEITVGNYTRWVMPENIPTDKEHEFIFEGMKKLYEDMGIERTRKLAGGVEAVHEMVEVRRLISDDHFYHADVYGHGRGMSFGAREFSALQRQGMLGDDSPVTRWLEDALNLGSDREAIQVQARGRYATLDRIMAGDSGALDQSLSTAQLRLLPGGQRGYAPGDLRGTVFDRSLYLNPETGKVDPTRGFWLDLGTDVEIGTGARTGYRKVNRIWVGPQQLAKSKEGLLLFDESHKKLNDLLITTEAYRATALQGADDIAPGVLDAIAASGDDMLRAVAGGDTVVLQRMVEQSANEYAQEFAKDLTSSSSVFAKSGVGGRLATSANLQVKLISPAMWQDFIDSNNIKSPNAMLDPYAVFVPEARVREMLGDLADETIVTRAGSKMSMIDMIKNEGVLGITERYPNIHEKSLGIARIYAAPDMVDNIMYLSPMQGMMHFNADQDSDRMVFALPLNAKLKPASKVTGQLTDDFYAVQDKLAEGMQAMVEGEGHFEFLSRGTLLANLADEFHGGKLDAGNLLDFDSFIKEKIGKFTGTLADEQLEIATRAGKVQVGPMSNLSLRLRAFGAAQYLGEAQRLGMNAADEAVRENLNKWQAVQALGRLMEQDTFTPKHQTATEYLSSLQKVHRSFSGEGLDAASLKGGLLELFDKDEGKLNKALQTFVKDTSTPAFTIDQAIAAAGELRDSNAKMWNLSFTRVGVSSGPMGKPDAGIGDVWRTLQTDPDVAPLQPLTIVQKTLGIEPSGADYKPETPSGRYRRVEQGFGSAEQGFRKVLEEAGETAEEQTRKTFSEKIDDAFGAGAGPKVTGALGIGAALITLGLAARVVLNRDRDLAPRDDDAQSPPVTSPTGEQIVRVAENTPRGMSIRVRARGNIKPEHAGGMVNHAIQSSLPVDLTTNIHVRDSTRDFDQNFIQKLFAKAL